MTHNNTQLVQRLRSMKLAPDAHVAADRLEQFQTEKAELLAALKTVIAQINDYEQVNNLFPGPGRSECWDCVAQAKQVIAKVEKNNV